MANTTHLERLLAGATVWNRWRDASDETPDLSGATLSADFEEQGLNFRETNLSGLNAPGIKLTGCDFERADLTGVQLQRAYFLGCNFSGTGFRRAHINDGTFLRCVIQGSDFEEAYLRDITFHEVKTYGTRFIRATLSDADLSKSRFEDVDFRWSSLDHVNFTSSALYRCDFQTAGARSSNFTRAHLSEVDFRGANLERCVFVWTTFDRVRLENCWIHGVSVWDVKMFDTTEANLVITPGTANSHIVVDSLEIAQFLYLLLSNARIRHVIDSIASKVVLILGRFTPARKRVLDAMREELRRRDLVPVIFDFELPATRDTSETVSTLAHLCRFIVADLTDPRSIPQELQAIVPNLLSVPVQPLLEAGSSTYGMFDHIARYPNVLPIVAYESVDQLISDLADRVIGPADARALELRTQHSR